MEQLRKRFDQLSAEEETGDLEEETSEEIEESSRYYFRGLRFSIPDCNKTAQDALNKLEYLLHEKFNPYPID